MKELQEELVQKRNELDDLKLDIIAKANELRHHPHFKKAEQLDHAASAVDKANAELFYAQLALQC